MIKIDWKPSQRNLRVFGIAALVVFGALGTWVFFSGKLFGFALSEETAKVVSWVLWALAGYGGVFSPIFPRALWPLYASMTLITLPIGFVLSYVIMAVIFYGLITPTGLLFRLIGRDPMKRHFDPEASTYWVRRESHSPPGRYFRQF